MKTQDRQPDDHTLDLAQWWRNYIRGSARLLTESQALLDTVCARLTKSNRPEDREILKAYIKHRCQVQELLQKYKDVKTPDELRKQMQ